MSAKKQERKTAASEPAAWTSLLRSVVLQNQAARRVEQGADGSVTLAVPTRSKGFLFPPFSWLIRPPKERVTVLDPLGASIWRDCDGRHTVEEIIEKFAIVHQLSFHESRVSVTNYIKSLIQSGVLAVAVDTSSN